MTIRRATQDEIQTVLRPDIEWGWKIRFEHGVVEYRNRRTETGVAHRRYSNSKPFLHDGVVCVKYAGEIEPINGTFFETGTTSSVTGLNGMVGDYRLAWLDKYSKHSRD